MTTTLTTRSAVKAAGLRKAFGDKVVLDGIDLDIAEGTVFSLLGPNGAGKTTTVQILSTLLPADAGDISVAGFDLGPDPDGRPAPPRPQRGPAPGRRAARALRPREPARRPAASYSGGCVAGSTWR